jgi:hypothetical protein
MYVYTGEGDKSVWRRGRWCDLFFYTQIWFLWSEICTWLKRQHMTATNHVLRDTPIHSLCLRTLIIGYCQPSWKKIWVDACFLVDVYFHQKKKRREAGEENVTPKLFREAQNCLQWITMMQWILVQKRQTWKKNIDTRNLKDWTMFTTQ